MATRKKKMCEIKDIQRMIHVGGYIYCPDCGYRQHIFMAGHQNPTFESDIINYAFLGEHRLVKRPKNDSHV